jgi:hypothetical protein
MYIYILSGFISGQMDTKPAVTLKHIAFSHMISSKPVSGESKWVKIEEIEPPMLSPA